MNEKRIVTVSHEGPQTILRCWSAGKLAYEYRPTVKEAVFLACELLKAALRG